MMTRTNNPASSPTDTLTALNNEIRDLSDFVDNTRNITPHYLAQYARLLELIDRRDALTQEVA